ncbi:MAG: MarR family transcriptional regulator [Alphaproteobacteria bacterium]|nr:MarR family transcriptional regulator [Alphaproteobacteria bacterium]
MAAAMRWRAAGGHGLEPAAELNPMALRREATRTLRAVDRNAQTTSDDPEFAGMSQSLGYQIRYAYRAFVKALADELGIHRLTTSQWSALRVLWETEGLSQVELAQRMMVEKASLTSVLQAMEKSGLILRTRNADDRRKVNVFLTAAGRKLRDKVLPLGAGINRRAARGLSAEEVRQLRTLLAKVMRNLQS